MVNSVACGWSCRQAANINLIHHTTVDIAREQQRFESDKLARAGRTEVQIIMKSFVEKVGDRKTTKMPNRTPG